MCLAIPAKVISIDGATAKVSVGDVEYSASLLLLDDVVPGDYIMLHAGFGIQKVDAAEAEETLRLLKEIEQNSGHLINP